jgi:hypothetical protein
MFRKKAKKRLSVDSVFYDWQQLRANLHTMLPGDGFYFKSRLHTYAGLGGYVHKDGWYQLGYRWKWFCCHCGAPLTHLFGELDALQYGPADKVLTKDGRDANQPAMRLTQRCRECAKSAKPFEATPLGFDAKALVVLAQAGVDVSVVQAPRHYQPYRHPNRRHTILTADDLLMHERHKILVDNPDVASVRFAPSGERSGQP